LLFKQVVLTSKQKAMVFVLHLRRLAGTTAGSDFWPE